jgi:hypothetical protein
MILDWSPLLLLARRVGWRMSALVPLVGVKQTFNQHGR